MSTIFIQPYTSHKINLRWNRLKQLISFLQVLWAWVDWRPPLGQFRPEVQLFGHPTNCHFLEKTGAEKSRRSVS